MAARNGYLRVLARTMRLDLLWFAPLCLIALSYLAIPNASSGLHNVVIVIHRFTWAIFFSPSAYLFLASVLASVVVPVQLLMLIPVFFTADAPGHTRRYLYSVALALGTLVASVLLQVLVWGSFPLPVDSDGYVRLRLIPFLPWPETPLFQ